MTKTFTHLLLVTLASLLFAPDVVLGQQVSGTVRDSTDGSPLPGANIVVKGTTQGTTTDPDGAYQLAVPSLSDTLVFSFVGYQPKEVPIAGRTQVDVGLVSTALVGEELVVIGYGSIQKSDLTGSVSSLPADQLNTGPQVSVNQAIQGRVPGVQVTQTSAEPGGGYSIRIRGTNSITAGNEPLYVVDGLPGANPLNSLNPADIQSI